MTDMSEQYEVLDQPEPSNTPVSEFQEGDVLTIIHGNDRNKLGTVVGESAENGQYVLKLEDGRFLVTSAGNVKAAPEAQVPVSRLARVMHAWRQSDFDADALILDLRETFSGFSEAYDKL